MELSLQFYLPHQLNKNTNKMPRRVAYSGKKKRVQLREKRERLRERALEEEEERYRALR